MMTSVLCSVFVADGYERARDANERLVRAEVEQEFAERLRNADWVDRWRMKREIERVIEKRLEHVAPPWGLYFINLEL